MNRFKALFPFKRTNIIGMVHVRALPGTPNSSLSIAKITHKALEETEAYFEAGVDSVIIENMHDIPYVTSDLIGPEIVASMTSVATEVRKLVPRSNPVGIQILAGANEAAIAVAQAAGLQYIRAESYVFSHVADEGIMNACAGPLLRYRKKIGANDVLVFCDVKKKHSSHAITADIDIGRAIRAAEFFAADAVILTGTETGSEVNSDDFNKVLRKSPDIPILIGSGVTLENLERFRYANGLIVGSYFKESGFWRNELDLEKIKRFIQRVKKME